MDLVKQEKSLRDHRISYKLPNKHMETYFKPENGTNFMDNSKWGPQVSRATQWSSHGAW